MIVKFMESVEQFERIINDTGYIKLRRLTDDEIVGTDNSSGIIEKYMVEKPRLIDPGKQARLTPESKISLTPFE